MAPRGFTLPSAKTDSAKAARSAFFCDLCQKGYSRMNEFEAHEMSYDHQHKKRLKDMKDMQKSVQNAGRKEEKGPLMSIKLAAAKEVGKTGSGGFKKGGFRNAFGREEDSIMPPEEVERAIDTPTVEAADTDDDSDLTDQEDYYNPRRPAGCRLECDR